MMYVLTSNKTSLNKRFIMRQILQTLLRILNRVSINCQFVLATTKMLSTKFYKMYSLPFGSDRTRATVSHATAQQSGLKTFFSELPPSVSKDIDIGVAVYDDASMWVRDPTASSSTETFSTEFLKRCQESAGKKGKNVHLPVMNQSEDLFSGR